MEAIRGLTKNHTLGNPVRLAIMLYLLPRSRALFNELISILFSSIDQKVPGLTQMLVDQHPLKTCHRHMGFFPDGCCGHGGTGIETTRHFRRFILAKEPNSICPAALAVAHLGKILFTAVTQAVHHGLIRFCDISKGSIRIGQHGHAVEDQGK